MNGEAHSFLFQGEGDLRGSGGQILKGHFSWRRYSVLELMTILFAGLLLPFSIQLVLLSTSPVPWESEVWRVAGDLSWRLIPVATLAVLAGLITQMRVLSTFAMVPHITFSLSVGIFYNAYVLIDFPGDLGNRTKFLILPLVSIFSSPGEFGYLAVLYRLVFSLSFFLLVLLYFSLWHKTLKSYLMRLLRNLNLRQSLTQKGEDNMGLGDRWREKKAQIEEQFGEALAWGLFDTRMITVYSKGYIGVGTRPPERLLDIQGETDVNKKTGIGRGSAALLTGGISLLSPSQRGNLYLTITTESTVHTLVDTKPTTMAIQAMHRIVATGKSVMSQQRPYSSANTTNTTTGDDVASQLAKLSDLREKGALSDAEFEQAKRKLLEN